MSDKATVTRYVVTYINRDGMREMLGAKQGRHTYATEREANDYLKTMKANNDLAMMERLYGPIGSLAVRPCECWPGHFDPVGIYFDDPDAPFDRSLQGGDL